MFQPSPVASRAVVSAIRNPPFVPRLSLFTYPVACYLSIHFVSTSTYFYLPARKGAIFTLRSEPFGGSMQVAIIADDLTGAADTGVQLARAGYRTAVAFRDTPIPPPEDLDAVVVDTDSRAMPDGFATKRVLETVPAVRYARIVYKKLDSTLRGPIAAELAAALGASGRDRAVVAPAFPSAGRTTVG